MKDNTVKTVFLKLIVLTVFYLVLQLLCGWFVQPEIVRESQYLVWKKFFVLTSTISICGLALGYYLSEKRGYQRGGYVLINCLASFLTLLIILLLSCIIQQPLLFTDSSREGIDYLLTFLCAGESFFESIVFGIFFKVVCCIRKKK